jgi:hypothetical protein
MVTYDFQNETWQITSAWMHYITFVVLSAVMLITILWT